MGEWLLGSSIMALFNRWVRWVQAVPPRWWLRCLGASPRDGGEHLVSEQRTKTLPAGGRLFRALQQPPHHLRHPLDDGADDGEELLLLLAWVVSPE